MIRLRRCALLRKQDEETRRSPEGHGPRAATHKEIASAPKNPRLHGNLASQDVKQACRGTPTCGLPSALRPLYHHKGTSFLPGFSQQRHCLFSSLTASEHTVFMHLHSVTSWAKTARNGRLEAVSKERESGTKHSTLRQNRAQDRPPSMAASTRQICGYSSLSKPVLRAAPSRAQVRLAG